MALAIDSAFCPTNMSKKVFVRMNMKKIIIFEEIWPDRHDFFRGGALAGIQNMNIMFGLDEETGLDFYGIHPY